MAKNKIKSLFNDIAWFGTNATLVLDKGQEVYLSGQAYPQYKVGDGVTALSALKFSTDIVSDVVNALNIAIATKQAKLDGGTGFVYSTVGAITYVTLASIGDISSPSNLTPGYYAVALGNKTIGNGRIYQDATSIKAYSPSTSSYVNVTDADLSLSYATIFGTSVVSLKNYQTLISYAGTNPGNIKIDDSGMVFLDTASINLVCNTVRLNNLTGDRVLTLNSSLAITPSAVTSNELLNVANSRSNLQAQIDAVYQGISWKDEVKAATTANITLSGAQTIDTIALVAGDRCLVKNQTTASQNGIYIVSLTGWIRATDADTTSELVKATVGVRLGGQKDTWWSCNNTNEPVVGTDSINFVQVPGAGATYTAGAGISLSGGAITITAGGVVNSMIAANTIDLSAKVTNVLKYANGGTQTSTIPVAGALPYATLAGYAYDAANYNYDPGLKTLALNNIKVRPSDGGVGLSVEGKAVLLNLNATDAGKTALIITGAGDSMTAYSLSGTAGKFTSAEYAGEFNQDAIITADIDCEAVSINRMFRRADASTVKATGAIHVVRDLTDESVSSFGTGSGYLYQKRNNLGVNITRFEATSTGELFFQTQTNIKATVSGTIEVDTAQVGTVGSTLSDIFTKSIKASTLSNVGDSIEVEYSLIFNELTKTKSLTIFFGGVTLLNVPAFSITTTPGYGRIKVLIIKKASNSIAYHVTASVQDGSVLTTPVVFLETSGIATPTLTGANTLRVSAACSSGSANNGVVANFAVYKLNPKLA